ncbi:MAG: hypothetical protein GY801_24835 [bacterium]|nr:hypothetical protein [bacterium]
MRINSAMMGKLACDLIVSRLKKPSRELHVLKVKQQLVKRGSCRHIT